MTGSWRGLVAVSLFACTREPVAEPARAEPAKVEPIVVEPAVVEPPPNSSPLVQHPAEVEGFIQATLPPHGA